MTDIVTNLWSMGVHGPVETEIKAIVDTFAAGDGFFVLQAVRPQHFTALAEVIGRPEWNDDPRFTGSAGWIDNAGEVRAAIEAWAASRTKVEAAAALSAAGLAAGPCLTPPRSSPIPMWPPRTCWWRCPAAMAWPSPSWSRATPSSCRPWPRA